MRTRWGSTSFRSLGSIVAAIAVLGTFSLTATSCGSDTPSRDDFITQIRKITNPPVDKALAGCAYDNLKDNPRLLKLATTNSTIPAKDDSELSKILARCILTGGTTTTTTKSHSSKKHSSG